jgi:hypothetical protein
MSTAMKEGDDDHIRGFILNKLYTLGLWGRRSSGVHHGHTNVDNLRKGYPQKYRDKFPKIIKRMKSNAQQLIMVFPSTGEEHVCANLDQVEQGLILCNKYREAVGLPPLNEQFKEVMQ